MNLYKWLYTRVGGRMWTYILRDSWVDVEVLWILGLLWIGAFIGLDEMKEVTIIGLVFYLLAHLFWGTRQIYHQGLKEDKKK